MNEFITLKFLGTFAGVVAVVLLIVQFLKLPLDKVWKIPTRMIVWLISLIVLFSLGLIQDTITPETAFLTVLNSIVVTVSALGSYEITIKKLEQKKSPPGNKDP